MKHWLSKTVLLSGLLFSSVGAYAAEAKSELVKQGEYLARLGGCVSCHTQDGGDLMAGGRDIHTPFGSIPAPNITPDKTGIGAWSFDDFWQAMHHGKGEKGKLLYPAFPYTSYTKLHKDDAAAIFAYLQSIPAVERLNTEPQLDFPYNVRSGLLVWRGLYFKDGEYQKNTGQSEQWNRGAYLVEGLGHCNECHTTRNTLGAAEQSSVLVGGLIPEQYWYAPNLSMQKGGDLYGWTQADIVAALTTGMSSRGSVLGPMAEVVHNSTQHLTKTDAEAIAVYLQSIPAPKAAAAKFVKANDLEQGKQLFTKGCAGCHGAKGEGKTGVYPALAGNISVTEPTGVNAIRVVLLGGLTVTTHHNPEPYSMPAFDDWDNQQVASVVNYIRQSFGNQAAAISADTVKAVRYKPAH